MDLHGLKERTNKIRNVRAIRNLLARHRLRCRRRTIVSVIAMPFASLFGIITALTVRRRRRIYVGVCFVHNLFFCFLLADMNIAHTLISIDTFLEHTARAIQIENTLLVCWSVFVRVHFVRVGACP